MGLYMGLTGEYRMYEARIYVVDKKVYVICDLFDDAGEFHGCIYLTKNDSKIIEHECGEGVAFDTIEPFHVFA